MLYKCWDPVELNDRDPLKALLVSIFLVRVIFFNSVLPGSVTGDLVKIFYIKELDEKLNPIRHHYLGDQEAIAKKAAEVAAQGKAK